MPFMFENLEIYQKAVDFADEITTLTEAFPRGYGFLADQLNRAALSITTNLAEGNGRFNKADRLFEKLLKDTDFERLDGYHALRR